MPRAGALRGRLVDVSILIPIRDERGTLEELTARCLEQRARLGRSVEILFVEDGPTDGSWELIRELAERHDEVIGIRQRRNFGKAPPIRTPTASENGRVTFTVRARMRFRRRRPVALVRRSLRASSGAAP